MINYIIRRVLIMIPTLIAVSVLVFVVIQLPPGDIITSRLQELQAEGQDISEEQIAALRARYHLDDPMFIQYCKWIGGFLQGDMGYSVMYGQSVNNLIWERLGYTLLITSTATLLTWLVAFPVGVYSALRQYSALDYAATLAAFVGLATPNFLLALVLMYLGYEWFGIAVGGLFSPEYASAPWSLAKLADFLGHLWIPAVVIGTAGMAGLMRIMRANLLDELGKPYVTTALAKGLGPIRLVIVPVAHCHQSLYQHGRLDAAAPDLRLGHHQRGVEPADDRPLAARFPAQPRHVFGGQFPPHAQRPDGDRHPAIGHSLGHCRSAHPL